MKESRALAKMRQAIEKLAADYGALKGQVDTFQADVTKRLTRIERKVDRLLEALEGEKEVLVEAQEGSQKEVEAEKPKRAARKSATAD